MCIPTGTDYVIVKVEEQWTDFRLEHDGKYVTLWGKDPLYDKPAYGDHDDIVLISCAYEHHRSDFRYGEIFSEAWCDLDGLYGKYLIIKRKQTKPGQ